MGDRLCSLTIKGQIVWEQRVGRGRGHSLLPYKKGAKSVGDTL